MNLPDLVVDADLCTGCRTCQIVCSLSHERKIDLDLSRIWVVFDRETAQFEPHLCRLCDSPDCVAACPTEALRQDSRTKIVHVDKDLCNGCRACIDACPYGSAHWNYAEELPFVCDRCGGNPICAKFCVTGCIKLMGT